MLDENKLDTEQSSKCRIEKNEFCCYLPESNEIAGWFGSSINDFCPVIRRPNFEPSGGMSNSFSLSEHWRKPINLLSCNQ